MYAKYRESEMQRRRGRAALRTTGLIVVPCARHIAYPLSAVPTTATRSSKAGRRTRTADPERGAVRVTVGFTSTHDCSSYRAPRRGEEDARLDPEGPPDSAADSESGGAEI